MSDNAVFGLAHLWAQGDSVAHGVAIALLVMSVASWFVILSKLWLWLRNRGTVAAIDAYWEAESPALGLASLQNKTADGPAAILAARTHAAVLHCERNAQGKPQGHIDRGDFLTRGLRQAISRCQADLEGGLTLLATVGSTAPFVGLLGTVWGIYHALVRIGASGQATLDTVAGPVGEALIMTAAGLAVALPAVMAYNAYVRSNRILLAELDGFAHDLHAYFTTGGRVAVAVQAIHADARAAARLHPAGAA